MSTETEIDPFKPTPENIHTLALAINHYVMVGGTFGECEAKIADNKIHLAIPVVLDPADPMSVSDFGKFKNRIDEINKEDDLEISLDLWGDIPPKKGYMLFIAIPWMLDFACALVRSGGKLGYGSRKPILDAEIAAFKRSLLN